MSKLIKTVKVILATALIVTSFADAKNDIEKVNYSVLERILFPCLIDLSEAYRTTEDKEYKRNIEYKLYRHQFVYWIHVYKFGENRSELIEQAFSSFNIQAFESKEYIEMVRTGGMFFSDEREFLGMKMTSGEKEIHIAKNEVQDFNELTNDFIRFMRDLRDQREKENKSIKKIMRDFRSQ